jgi:hypothetical protein
VDLVGLATRDVFIAKRDGNYSTQTLDDVVSARRVQIAVIYDSWFGPHPKVLFEGPSVPDTWIRVARWKVPERLQLGGDTVSFYAVEPEQADLLRMRLREYENKLPASVTVR